MRLDAYQNLVYEFYSSLRMKTDGRDNILDYIIEFKLHGQNFKLTPEQLVEWLKCDCEGILNTLAFFTSGGTWIDLGGHEMYDPHGSKFTKL